LRVAPIASSEAWMSMFERDVIANSDLGVSWQREAGEDRWLPASLWIAAERGAEAQSRS